MNRRKHRIVVELTTSRPISARIAKNIMDRFLRNPSMYVIGEVEALYDLNVQKFSAKRFSRVVQGLKEQGKL